MHSNRLYQEAACSVGGVREWFALLCCLQIPQQPSHSHVLSPLYTPSPPAALTTQNIEEEQASGIPLLCLTLACIGQDSMSRVCSFPGLYICGQVEWFISVWAVSFYYNAVYVMANLIIGRSVVFVLVSSLLPTLLSGLPKVQIWSCHFPSQQHFRLPKIVY